MLDVIPAILRVLRTIRPKYACRGCTDGVVQAKVPLGILQVDGYATYRALACGHGGTIQLAFDAASNGGPCPCQHRHRCAGSPRRTRQRASAETCCRASYLG